MCDYCTTRRISRVYFVATYSVPSPGLCSDVISIRKMYDVAPVAHVKLPRIMGGILKKYVIDRVYRSKLKTGSEHYNGIFKTLKAEIQRKLRRSYWEYIQGLITQDAENTGDRPSLYKRFYTYLKNNKTDKNGIASLRDEGLRHSNPRDKAQILNKQFQSVFTPESALPLSALAQSILPSVYPDMPEIQVNEPGIIKLLQNLKPH